MVRIARKKVQNTKLLWAICREPEAGEWKISLPCIRWYQDMSRSANGWIKYQDWKGNKLTFQK
jgi:hypothetical protein